MALVREAVFFRAERRGDLPLRIDDGGHYLIDHTHTPRRQLDFQATAGTINRSASRRSNRLVTPAPLNISDFDSCFGVRVKRGPERRSAASTTNLPRDRLHFSNSR